MFCKFSQVSKFHSSACLFGNVIVCVRSYLKETDCPKYRAPLETLRQDLDCKGIIFGALVLALTRRASRELGLGEPPELGLPGSRLRLSGLCTKLFLRRIWDCGRGMLCKSGQEVLQLKLLGSKLPLLPLLGLHPWPLGCPPEVGGRVQLSTPCLTSSAEPTPRAQTSIVTPGLIHTNV